MFKLSNSFGISFEPGLFLQNINLCLKNSGPLKWFNFHGIKWNCMFHTHTHIPYGTYMVTWFMAILFNFSLVCLKWAKWEDLNIFQILFIHFHSCANFVRSLTLCVVLIVQITSNSTKVARCHFVIKLDNVCNTNTYAKSLAKSPVQTNIEEII